MSKYQGKKSGLPSTGYNNSNQNYLSMGMNKVLSWDRSHRTGQGSRRHTKRHLAEEYDRQELSPGVCDPADEMSGA